MFVVNIIHKVLNGDVRIERDGGRNNLKGPESTQEW